VTGSPAFEAARHFVRARLAPAYESLGSLSFVYCQGSMVENLSNSSDIDVVCVWAAELPSTSLRPPEGIAEAQPDPVVQASHDRFFASGQEFDVNHIRLADWNDWIEQLERGSGCSGYPMPVVAAHGLSSGIVLLDRSDAGSRLQAQLAAFPEALSVGASQRARREMPSFLEVLERCAEEGDGLLFHSEISQAARLAWIGWFAAQGRYWPFEKRLNLRLRLLGRKDLADAEREVWRRGPNLSDRLLAFRKLLHQLLAELPEQA
jgi:hypothetical protein